MNTKNTIIVVLLAIVSLAVSAQEEKAGWLWEVSGNGLTQKFYLFGTCHGEGHNFTKEEVFGIGGLQKAFDKSETVLFEQDMNPNQKPSEEVMQFNRWIVEFFRYPGPEYMTPEGTNYAQWYDDVTHFNMVDSCLSIKMNDKEYWKKTPKYWHTRIGIIIFIGTRRQQILDAVLYQEAAKSGKTCGHLEEIGDIKETLISSFTDTPGFDTLSIKEQADSLYKTIRDLNSGKTKKELRRFYNTYIKNDTCLMVKLFAEHPEYNENDSSTLDQRNYNWMPVIRENIAAKSCMIAVGCRHLLGTHGLIALLRKEGYKVEPVR